MNQDLQNRLDRLALLVHDGADQDDPLDPIEEVEQIALLINLKLLDEETEADAQRTADRGRLATAAFHGLFPLQTERYRWRRWRSLDVSEQLAFARDEVLPYMASVGKTDPRTAAFFRGATLRMRDAETFRRIVDEIDAIEFLELRTQDRSEVMEYLLDNLPAATASEFRTPRRVRQVMVRMLDPDEGESIYDPACGTAGFLVDAGGHVRARYGNGTEEVGSHCRDGFNQRERARLWSERGEPTGETQSDLGRLAAALHGAELARPVSRIATVNLALHGLRGAPFEHGDSLAAARNASRDKYRIVLSNPPMGARIRSQRIRSDLAGTSRRSDLLFLRLAMESLGAAGRCAVIVHDGLLSGMARPFRELRERLARGFQVTAVAPLAPAVYGRSSRLRTSVLTFRRPDGHSAGDSPATRQVWFSRALAGGVADRLASRHEPQAPDFAGLLADWKIYRESGFSAPPGVEARSVIEPGSEAPRSWWASFETLARSNYSLDASHYAPTVLEPPPDDEPADLLREAIAIEKQVVTTLEELLREVEA